MDPTEILAIPYPLQRLVTYVSITFLVVCLFNVWFWGPAQREAAHFFQATLLATMLLILCGVDPRKHSLHTLCSAVYLATLAWLSRCRSPRKSALFIEDELHRLLDTAKLEQWEDLLASSQIYGTLLVAIPIQILHVFDWGAQIQRFPLPIILGCTYGWVVGTVGGWGLVGWRQRQRAQTQPHETLRDE
jgi:hypothetical protein